MFSAIGLGFLFGFIGSIPVAGPVSALVLSRGIQGRFRSGIFISLGAGIAEATYAFLAFWGFSTYLTRYSFIVPVSRAAAAVILAILGYSFLISKTGDLKDRPGRGDSFIGSFVLGFSLTALNPTLVATWTAAVTTLFSMQIVDFTSGQALPFASGTCVGIAAWFGSLLLLIRYNRKRFTTATLQRIVRVVGAFLITLCVWFLLRFIDYLTVGT